MPEYRTFIIHGDCLYRNISPWNPKVWKLEPRFKALQEKMLPSDSASLDELLAYLQECRMLAEGDEDKPMSQRFKKLRSAIRLVFPIRRPFEILKCWGQHGKRLESFHQLYTSLFQYLIVGHIHRPGIYSLKNNSTGINTGGFLSVGEGRIVELSLSESKEPKVAVHLVEETGGQFRIGRLIDTP